tara:strand:- start:32 stop:220 length:189 start_codon:yes stop_codon:yes gene_type:complete
VVTTKANMAVIGSKNKIVSNIANPLLATIGFSERMKMILNQVVKVAHFRKKGAQIFLRSLIA